MTKDCFIIRSNKKTLRVRKEEFGCIIFDSEDIYAEGNKTVFEIMSKISDELPYAEIISQISEEYNMPKEIIKRDMEEFFEKAHLLGWLEDINRKE